MSDGDITAEEYVKEQLVEVEHHLEEALYACESREMRGELTATYRSVVAYSTDTTTSEKRTSRR